MKFDIPDPSENPPTRPQTTRSFLSATTIAVPPFAATLLHLDFGEETGASPFDDQPTVPN